MKQGIVSILIFRCFSSVLSPGSVSDFIPIEKSGTISLDNSSKPLSIIDVHRAFPIFALHLRCLFFNTYKATPNCRVTNAF